MIESVKWEIKDNSLNGKNAVELIVKTAI